MNYQTLLQETGVLCVQGMMSTCAGCDSQRTQERCGLYEKATHHNRCMSLVFDEYCDSVAAQAASQGDYVPMKRKLAAPIRDEDEYYRRQQERDRAMSRKKIRIRRRSADDRY